MMSELNLTNEYKKTIPWKLAIIFVLFSAAIILLGVFYYNSQRKRIFTEEEDNLSVIASMKISQIERWRRERLGDAAVISLDKPLIKSFASLLSSYNREAETDIYDWMKSVRNAYDYKNVLIADTSFKVRLSVLASDTVPGDPIKKELKTILKSHTPFLTDLHMSKEVPYIHLDIIIPLFDSVNKKQKPIGVAILRIDPNKILFPLIQSWPTQSKSSETLLLRKEGDSILYLNELRHAKNTALRLRLPLTNKNLLATKAFFGLEGLVEGVDYRNIPVIGSIYKIPETTWYLIAKVDKEEILLPLQRYVLLIIIVVVLLILINASIFGFWIWQQRIRFYSSQLKNESSIHELEERFTTAFRMSPVSVTISSVSDNKFIDVNNAFLHDMEYTREEVIGRTAKELNVWADEDEREWIVNQISEKGKIIGKVISYKTRTGKILYGLASMSEVKVNGESCNLSTVVNITENRKAEEKLKESEELFRKLFENMLNGFAYCKIIYEEGHPPDFLYLKVNESFSALTGLKDVIGKKASEVIPGIQEADPELLERYGRVAMTGQPEVFETWVEALKMWFAISVYSPQKGYFVAVFDVITARKLAENTLRENEKRLHEAQEMAHLGFWLWDIKTGGVEWSEEVYKIFCLNPETFTPKIDSILELSPWPEDHKRDTELINRAMESHTPGDYEQKFLRPDNSIGYYYSTFRGNYDNSGELISIVGTVLDITEQKNVELALSESEERFRSLYENATIGIYRTTADGKILMANPALVNMLGFESFEELAKRNLDKEGYEPDYPRKEFIETLEEQGRIRGLEAAWHKRDGSILYVRESTVAIRDDKGKILYYDGNVEDVTEWKKTEEALRESEDKFKYIFDHSVAAKSITFPSGEIQVNKAFCEMMGYSHEELSNTKWQDISFPDDISLTENEIRSLISGEKKSTRFIKRYIHKNGDIVWADVGTALRRDENGKPLYFMTTAIDITERKHAEESLRLKNFVFDDSIAANSISDINGILTEVNEAFVRIWGYQSKNEVIGKSIASFIKSDADANKILVALKKDGEWEGDYSALRKDGSIFIAHGLATLVKDEKGRGIGYQSAVLDVTDAKRSEELIHQLNEELEQKVILRTELLKAANKELEAFSYSVSHDLRAPLRSVHGYTKILLEEYESKLDEEGKRICGIISSSATQMGELIDDLLSFSRIGRTSMNPSQLDMKSIVKSVFEEICPNNQKSRTNLKIGKLHKAFGDANLLKLVWTNLISNAIKYSSKKKISEISIMSELKYNRVTYSVKDNGVGFDMNYKHKLFGVFQRLHSESEFEGNGVGLAIVQRIVLKHGGKVWAEGEVGKGATFYFSLPVQGINK